MARSTVDVTTTFQQVATVACVISIKQLGTGALIFNELADDATATGYVPDIVDQFQQTENKATWVRTTGEGWQIVVDTAG